MAHPLYWEKQREVAYSGPGEISERFSLPDGGWTEWEVCVTREQTEQQHAEQLAWIMNVGKAEQARVEELTEELAVAQKEIGQLRESANANFQKYKLVVEREQAWREQVREKLRELRAECEEEMPTPGQAATNSFADGYYDGLEYAIGKLRKLERELGLTKEKL